MGTNEPSLFKRLVLPGLAFKAVVIGGGYATGRELAEFFLPSGPAGGLLGMIVAALVWSAICALTFLLARRVSAYDYRSFFQALLGPIWPFFEVSYFIFLVLVLAVFGAAAGEISHAIFMVPRVAGTAFLGVSILLFAAAGNSSVERLFKWVSIALYGTYLTFGVLTLSSFGGQAMDNLRHQPVLEGWFAGGLTYAAYNAVGAVIVLPVVRHMRSSRDALFAGVLAGPLAMAPGLVFFLGMICFYPDIASAALPSDVILTALGKPWFHLLFQTMILLALLESGTGCVHAVNERIAHALRTAGRDFSMGARVIVTGATLVLAMLLAERVGLVTLIASGYQFLAWLLLAVYVVPVATLGLWKIIRPAPPADLEESRL